MNLTRIKLNILTKYKSVERQNGSSVDSIIDAEHELS